MRTLALTLTLAVALTGCGSGSTDRTPSPSAVTTGPPIDSVAAFQEFSGLTIPGTAAGVTVDVTVDPGGLRTYKVGFDLPSADLDAFCTSGKMSQPLRVVTIPNRIREAFDYTGGSSTGVAIAEASLPSDPRIQRQVFAVGTKTTTSDVQVRAFQIPS